jgi:hypothetical protein
MPPPPTAFEVAVLAALRSAVAQYGVDGKLHEDNLETLQGIGVSLDIVRPMMDSLAERGFVEFFPSKPHLTVDFGGLAGSKPITIDSPKAWRLTALGARASFGEPLDEYQPSPDMEVPASDRVVRLDDNAPGRAEAIAHLEEVERVLSSNPNDLELTADERMVVLSEIRPFAKRLRDGWVRVGELRAAVTKGSMLVWLTDKLAGAGIVCAITLALGALGKLLLHLGG